MNDLILLPLVWGHERNVCFWTVAVLRVGASKVLVLVRRARWPWAWALCRPGGRTQVLCEAPQKVCLLWCNTWKAIPEEHSLSIGERLVSQTNLVLLMATRIFLSKAEAWKFVKPRKQSDCTRINLMSKKKLLNLMSFLDISWPEHKASYKQQRGPVVFSMDLCTEVSSLSRSCVYFWDFNGEFWFKTELSKVGENRQSSDGIEQLSSMSLTWS